MHAHDNVLDRLAHQILGATLDRVREGPSDIGSSVSQEQLDHDLAGTITEAGLGGQVALQRFLEVAEPACISIDHPLELAFVPAAPTKASLLFDALLGAISIDASTWLEGSGAIHLENQTLSWFASLAGMGPDAGGCFVPGGTVGNLSALVAARQDARAAGKSAGTIVAAESSHSSILSAANVMDADLVTAPSHDGLTITGGSVEATLDARGDDVFAVVATAGTTSTGSIDDLAGIAAVCAERGIWFHVDAAYGGAGLLSSLADRYHGLGDADSVIVDPHKWLFAPYDSCALVYRDPARARAAHRQLAGYLEDRDSVEGWNPSDYAIHLSRRARGLPLWFSLAAHGTGEYRRAVEQTLRVAADVEAIIAALPHITLACERTLTVIVFRVDGWTTDDYRRWSQQLRSSGQAFVSTTEIRSSSDPSTETCGRICIVNPTTTAEQISAILPPLETPASPHA